MARRFWPMQRGLVITSGFGPRGGTVHRGLDFGWAAGAAGLPVYAAQGGTVEFRRYDAPVDGPGTGFGWYFGIDHSDADGSGYTVYGHTILEIAVGQRVEAGQRVGHINPDRDSNGDVDPHLHLEVFTSTYRPGLQIDPLPWLAGADYPGNPRVGGGDRVVELAPYREQVGAQLWSAAGNTEQLIVQHTTESESGNTNVIDYLEKTRNGSYQTMIDFDGEEVRMVPDNRQAWAAMASGNRIGLHVCAMGRAAFDRARWLSERLLLERTAMRYAEWSRLYGIPLVKIGPAEIRAGVRGVCGHIDISEAFGESDHSDPGRNFPYPEVIGRAKQLLNQEEPMSAAEVQQIQDFVAGFCGPIGADVKDIREQLCGAGSRDSGQYAGWPQLGSPPATVVDGLGAGLDQVAAMAARIAGLEESVRALLEAKA